MSKWKTTYIFLHFVKYLFIYSAVLGLSCSMQDLCCSMLDLCCSMQDLWLQCTQSVVVGMGSVVAAQLLCGMWDPSTPTRDLICIPYTARWILNYWTTRKVPYFSSFFFFYFDVEIFHKKRNVTFSVLEENETTLGN